jgi:DNA-binding Lrp family transcriptional regulator
VKRDETPSDVTDALDEQIVSALRRDGRVDAVSIAEEVDAVATTVQKRLRALEDGDAIEGYTVRLNYESLGYESVVLRIDTSLENADAVTMRLRETTNVVTVYETSDRYNVFAIGKFESDDDIGRLLEKLHSDPHVRNVDLQRARSTD